MRSSQETKTLVKNEALVSGQLKPIRDILPVTAESWERLRLMFKHAVTIGTGADPVALGAFHFLKNIIFKTSMSEYPFNLPGMGFYYLNLLLQGKKPFYDSVLAADGTYECTVDLPFSYDFLWYKDDLLLQTKDYSHLELQIMCGTIADLYGTPGTAVTAPKLDMIVSRSKNPFIPEQEAKAKTRRAMIFVKRMAPFNPTTQPYILFERADDLALFAFLMVAHTGATAGTPFSGTPADYLDDITFKDNLMPYAEGLTLSHFKAERQRMMGNSGASLTGLYPYLFAQDGSLYSAYGAAKRSEIRIDIDTIIGTPSNPQVDTIVIGMRSLR